MVTIKREVPADQVGSSSSSSPPLHGNPHLAANQDTNSHFQHYHMQLMLLEQQNKKKRMIELHAQEAELRETRERFTKLQEEERTLNQRRADASDLDAQMQIMLLQQQSNLELMQKKDTIDKLEKQIALFYINPEPYTIRNQEQYRGTLEGNHSLQAYQMQYMLLEQQDKNRRMLAKGPEDRPEKVSAPTATSKQYTNQIQEHQNVTAAGNHALQDYQLQKMLIEQQSKKKLMIAKQEQDRLEKESTPTASPRPYYTNHVQEQQNVLVGGNHALQDYQTQKVLLEQQNKKRVVMSEEEQDQFEEEQMRTLVLNGHSNYAAGLILLEQRNKKRLMIARDEQNRIDQQNRLALLNNHPTNHALQDYEWQLRVLDHRNKIQDQIGEDRELDKARQSEKRKMKMKEESEEPRSFGT